MSDSNEVVTDPRLEKRTRRRFSVAERKHLLAEADALPHGEKGAWLRRKGRFQWVREPTFAQLTQLAHTIARRVGRLLEREGLLERDTEQLDLGEVLDEDDPIPDLVGHSITYRIAVGPHRGRKVCH